MEVEVECWVWSPLGMRSTSSAYGIPTRYVTVRDMERQLEEAHRRGREQALADYKQLMECA